MLGDAARILLDYGGQDVVAAVDLLIRAEWWNEGQRIALLHGRQDLVRKCKDAAIAFAENAMVDCKNGVIPFVIPVPGTQRSW